MLYIVVLVVVIALISLSLAAITVSNTTFYQKLSKHLKPKAVAKKDTTPSIVKLRQKQAEILRKAKAREIAERQLEIAVKLELRKTIMTAKQQNIKQIIAKQ